MGLGDLFQKKLRGFGIPTTVAKRKEFNFWSPELAAKFTTSKSNLVVLGTQFYITCVRLMQLKLTYDALNRMKWITHSSINYDFDVSHLDTLALVELYPEPHDNRKRLPGSMVGIALSNGTSVLLGAKDVDCLEGAFPYDLESIENNFEIWKGE